MLYLSSYQPEERFKDKTTEHQLGRQLLSEGLKREYGRDWEVGIGSHGKPFLKGCLHIHFSISHTEGLVACAIADYPVGIDVERVRPFRQALMRKVCTEDEIAYILEGNTFDRMACGGMTESDFRFFSAWTLKESYIKATGEGLAFPMREISFTRNQDGSITGNVPDWHFKQWNLGEYILSACEYKRNDLEIGTMVAVKELNSCE